MIGRYWRISAVVLCFMLILAVTGITLLHGEAVFATEADSQAQTSAQEASDVYGYQGDLNQDLAQNTPLFAILGTQAADGAILVCKDNPAVVTMSRANIVVSNSSIATESSQKTVPADDVYKNLLIAGSVPATLCQGNSQSYVINSTITATDLGALCVTEAQVPFKGITKELSLYSYGSKAVAQEGGFGAYAGFLGNLWMFGTHVSAAEIGVLSDSCGKVTLGTIKDGEANSQLAAVLTDQDKDKRLNKELGGVVEGGRNALVIQSEARDITEDCKEYLGKEYLAEYQDYKGRELGLLSAQIDAHAADLKTDLSLDKSVEYDKQAQAYIDHTKGSVVVVKSTNAQITLDDCRLIPDSKGTGYLIQTVMGNNTESMLAVPDGETSPGIAVVMKNMKVEGDIAHEDYQRDFALELNEAEFTGAINGYGFEQWKEAASNEGFLDYCPDTAYNTVHKLDVLLKNKSVWNVTAESRLSGLEFEDNCTINGVIYLNGVEQTGKERSYQGDVVVKPFANSSSSGNTTKPEPTPHTHSWVVSESKAATCTADGSVTYKCSGCNESYTDKVPATGHAYAQTEDVAPTCETDGYTAYTCTRCGDVYKVPKPATGHSYIEVASAAPGCETDGYTYYECTECGAGYTVPIPATGHDWQRQGGSPATCTQDGTYGWVCYNCGATYLETLYGTALGHDWYLKISIPVGCVVDGEDIFECARCGETMSQITAPAYGHDYNFAYKVYPTCVDVGYDVYLCSHCGDALYENYVSPYGTEGELGHEYIYSGNYDTIYHYYVCKHCGKQYAEVHHNDPCVACGYSGPKG